MGMMYSRSLVAGYPFENSGADIMGVNNGTVYGAIYVDGQCGKALSFDGVNDYVDCGTNYNIGYNDASFSFWVTRDFTDAGLRGVFSKTAPISGFEGYIACFFTSNLLYVRLYNKTIIVPMSIIPLGVPTHVVISIDRSSLMRLYVNCVTIANIDISSTSSTNVISDRTFKIGAFARYVTGSQNALYFFKGLIENFKIYNKALTQSEVQRDYLNLPIF